MSLSCSEIQRVNVPRPWNLPAYDCHLPPHSRRPNRHYLPISWCMSQRCSGWCVLSLRISHLPVNVVVRPQFRWDLHIQLMNPVFPGLAMCECGNQVTSTNYMSGIQKTKRFSVIIIGHKANTIQASGLCTCVVRLVLPTNVPTTAPLAWDFRVPSGSSRDTYTWNIFMMRAYQYG